jgi:hypothetical protein
MLFLSNEITRLAQSLANERIQTNPVHDFDPIQSRVGMRRAGVATLLTATRCFFVGLRHGRKPSRQWLRPALP